MHTFFREGLNSFERCWKICSALQCNFGEKPNSYLTNFHRSRFLRNFHYLPNALRILNDVYVSNLNARTHLIEVACGPLDNVSTVWGNISQCYSGQQVISVHVLFVLWRAVTWVRLGIGSGSRRSEVIGACEIASRLISPIFICREKRLPFFHFL